MSYRRRKDEDVCCYNCKEKEQGSRGVEDKVKSILWEVMQKINWKLEDSSAKETKEEQSLSSSIDGVQ